MKIINYEEKEMIPLTKEENKSYKKQKICHICEEKGNLKKYVIYVKNGNL